MVMRVEFRISLVILEMYITCEIIAIVWNRREIAWCKSLNKQVL